MAPFPGDRTTRTNTGTSEAIGSSPRSVLIHPTHFVIHKLTHTATARDRLQLPLPYTSRHARQRLCRPVLHLSPGRRVRPGQTQRHPVRRRVPVQEQRRLVAGREDCIGSCVWGRWAGYYWIGGGVDTGFAASEWKVLTGPRIPSFLFHVWFWDLGHSTRTCCYNTDNAYV